MTDLFAAHLGEAAALATSVLWAFTALFFTLASLRIGSYTVNRIRLLLAVLFLSLLHLGLQGELFPSAATPAQWFWLGLSGLVGLTLGDTLLFQSLVDLGTQRAMLVMASWPIQAALLAFLLLGETLSLREGGGVILTIVSIGWVVSGKAAAQPSGTDGQTGSNPSRGIWLALGGALCQAVGVLMAKEALTEGFPPLSGTWIRMFCAAVGLWGVALVRRDALDAFRRLADQKGAFFTLCGAVTGPTLGVWMSLVAVAYAKVGVAAALMSLSPLLLLPLGRLFFNERITLRAVLGTLGALAGVWLLLM